jgi:hypothetical protein
MTSKKLNFALLDFWLFASMAAGYKNPIVIGGLSSEASEVLPALWKPVFEDYLNSNVGSHYEPPLNFSYVSLGTAQQTSLPEYLQNGMVDLVCEEPMKFLLSVT